MGVGPDRCRSTGRGTMFLALFVGVSSASLAVADSPEVYGRAHLAFTAIDDGGDYSSYNLSSNSSRVGFRGGHEFTRDLEGVYQIEGLVEFDDTDSSFDLASRDTFAGLRGDFGTVRAGRFDTPTKGIVSATSLFRDQVGDSRNVVRNGVSGGNDTSTGFDERFRNMAAYRTPDRHPLTVEAAYSPDTQGGTAEDGNPNDAYSVAVTYQSGPAYLALGHERWTFEDDENRHVTRAGAYHDWGGLRLSLLYQTATNPDDDAYGVGVRYRLADDLAVKAEHSALRADGDDLDARQYAVGAEYYASRELTLYVVGAVLANDDDQALSPWPQGISLDREPDGAQLAGEDAWAVAVGSVYRF